MTFRIINGPGIMINSSISYEYRDGMNQQISVLEICIDPYSQLSYSSGETTAEGNVLTLENSIPVWKSPNNPLENDGILRENSVPLQQAWDTLMKALAEYEMTKKLIQNEG